MHNQPGRRRDPAVYSMSVQWNSQSEARIYWVTVPAQSGESHKKDKAKPDRLNNREPQ